VQSIIRELRGEKIDIIEHSDDLVTFAQSALAPAKITRVSVTHQGEVPHLDVIVEDEQLSLAIGKRGQNVRLASELLACKIDVKSESDVKDEVAGALARMLQGEMAPQEGAGLDWSDAPVSAAVVDRLVAAGFDSIDALLEASSERLQEIHGVDEAAVASLREWAEGKRAAEASLGLDLSAFTEAAATESNVSDQDFMAALSKAFQETEPSAPTGDETNDQSTTAATDGDEEDKSS
jgi:N utilization substance protein A